MKRKTKQGDSGGRLRLGLLVASVAAFLLVPVAGASAEDGFIVFEGEGSGWVKGAAPGENGEPPIECHWNGTEIDIGTSVAEGSGAPGLNACETNLPEPIPGIKGIGVEQEADGGSEFGGWEALQGVPVSSCGLAVYCSVVFSPVEIKATFNLEPEEEFNLNLSTSGSGSGSLKCKVNGGPAGPCAAKYGEKKEVEVIPTADPGSAFVAFSGDCSGSSCVFAEMGEERSVNAQFDEEVYTFSTSVSGEGTVQCDVNGGGLGACPTETSYGDEIEVVATPAEGKVLSSLIGPGCDKEAGTCSITVTGNVAVSAEFASANTIAQQVENVHGEVPETTELATSCANDVDLGIFTPGVENRYWEICNLTVTSTGEESELRAKDETGKGLEGHLTQEAGKIYNLAEPLEMTAESTIPLNGVPNGGLEPLNAGGVTLMSYATPVSKDNVAAEFSQWIREHDPLHTGVYSKQITLTLEQTEP